MSAKVPTARNYTQDCSCRDHHHSTTSKLCLALTHCCVVLYVFNRLVCILPTSRKWTTLEALGLPNILSDSGDSPGASFFRVSRTYRSHHLYAAWKPPSGQIWLSGSSQRCSQSQEPGPVLFVLTPSIRLVSPCHMNRNQCKRSPGGSFQEPTRVPTVSI
jgi:hypothetical protein